MRVLIAVTHLLGSGHLSRALALGRAFAAAGWETRIASGGRPSPHLSADGLEFVQLPPLASDGIDFTRLLNAEGAEADAAYLERRAVALCKALRPAPDVLITELFPFGRRVLAAEFETLLRAAQALQRRPLILASIRDILAAPSKPKRVGETEARITDFYDGVLVHSDPDLTRLEASWPVTPKIAAKLRYTGYVAPPMPESSAEGPGLGEILVSAGGGPVGARLFEIALGAAALAPERRWRLLVGGVGRANALAARAPANAQVEPPRADFRAMLPRAACFVGQCGYNTALDVLAAGCPAVFAPFEEGGETEQRVRAEALRDAVGYAVQAEGDLTPEMLAAAIEAQIARGRPPGLAAQMDGAGRSVAIASEMLEAMR